eukprot:2840149-Prymnesium_polylepis.1
MYPKSHLAPLPYPPRVRSGILSARLPDSVSSRFVEARLPNDGGENSPGLHKCAFAAMAP